MLSEDEKQLIIERIKFETQIRKELDDSSKTPPTPWYQSKLGLLLIGAFITGILVPIFQFSQETINWKRENQAQNIEFRLEVMRSTLSEFSLLSSFIPESYERARPILEDSYETTGTLPGFHNWYNDLQARVFSQTAKVNGLLIYFDEKANPKLRKSLDSYLLGLSQYFALLRHAAKMHGKVCAPRTKSCLYLNVSEVRKEIDKKIPLLNHSYFYVVKLMKTQIRELESDSAIFR